MAGFDGISWKWFATSALLAIALGSTACFPSEESSSGGRPVLNLDDDDDNDDNDDSAKGSFDPSQYAVDCGELWKDVTDPPVDYYSVCQGGDSEILAREQEMFAAINIDRIAEHNEEANEAEPLLYDCKIAAVARIHSYTMCRDNVFAHSNLASLLSNHLGLTGGTNFFFTSENIAIDTSVQEGEDAFVEAEPECDKADGGHRLNILSWNLTHVGVGYCNCGAALGLAGDTLYLTQDFITYDEAKLHLDGQELVLSPYCDEKGWE